MALRFSGNFENDSFFFRYKIFAENIENQFFDIKWRRFAVYNGKNFSITKVADA